MKKLVRDKIPEIIISKGETPKTEIIKDDRKYCEFLEKKLLEEVNEFLEAKNIEEKMEELADIFEVIDSLCIFNNIDKNLVEKIKSKKFKERGGFSKRILLIKD